MDILISLPVILVTAFIAQASPGPATLAIASTSMTRGLSPGCGWRRAFSPARSSGRA